MSSNEEQIILWHPHINQAKLAQDKTRFKVVVCGRRFGKTTFAVNTLIEEALFNNNSLYFYVAPTYRQAKMIAWQMLIESLAKLPNKLIHKVNESELYCVLGNNSRIYIKGADNPDSLRGVGLNGIVLDEYADMKQNVFSDIIRPSLTDKKGWAIFIGTPKGFNHFYELFNFAQNNDNWKAWKFTSFDNPLLDQNEIESAKQELTQDKFAQEYMGEFKKYEGLVFKEFYREFHTFSDPPERVFTETIAGVDFGFTNPSCILKIGVDYDNTYYIMEEWYKPRKTNAEIIEKAKGMDLNILYPDPAEPDRIEEMQRAGLNCREVNKDITSGVDRVRELFKQQKIKIHKNCQNLIWELETYHYPESKLGYNNQEKPIKENDHAIDALRYALYTHRPRSFDDTPIVFPCGDGVLGDEHDPYF